MAFLPQPSQFILAWDRYRNMLDCIRPWQATLHEKKYRPHQPSELRLNDQSHDSQGWMSQSGQEGRIWSGQEEALPSSLPVHRPPVDEQTPWQALTETRQNQRARSWLRRPAGCDAECESRPAEVWQVLVLPTLRETHATSDVKSDSTLHSRPSSD